MDLPNWIYIVGIVILNILLILIICMIVFKNKESDIEIEKEVFKDETNENLASTNEIYKAMEKASEAPSKVESFEQEQEENAIISFQELLKFKEEQDKKMALEEKKEIKKEEKVEEAKEPKKFENTEVISPIFGRFSYPENTKADEHKLEKTLNLDPIKKEIKESEDFLNALKDFRKNL